MKRLTPLSKNRDDVSNSWFLRTHEFVKGIHHYIRCINVDAEASY